MYDVLENATFHKPKKQQKHLVYEHKSDTRRKVKIVIGTLINYETLIYVQNSFSIIFCYITVDRS